MTAIQKNTIYTNVLFKKDKTVWWEGGDPPVPSEGINWQGKSWRPGLMDDNRELVLGAHPNARFTVPIVNVPSITNRLEHHHGVPISAIIFGGRRAQLAPLVYESFNWQHGTFVGATMASERTAAQFGKQGEVRRDPMAMLPFCGYNMGDYFKHWLAMGKKMTPPPKIFNVNWFRKDDKGNFLWPGFGENLRVLEWIISRCKNEVDAVETPIGYLPHENDIDMTGMRIPRENMRKLLAISKKAWQQEAAGIEGFFQTFGRDLPGEMRSELTALKRRLKDH
jgi:phosphoenolpyruvate carboxykinase (GTP)